MVKPYYTDTWKTIYCEDTFDVLPMLELNPNTIVVTDPPYGITSNKWDNALDIKQLWQLLSRFNTCIITASQPFSSLVVFHNLANFKHEWIWQKNRGSNFANTVREPMKEHEHILVFSKCQWTYNPQMQNRKGGGSERVKYNVAFRTKSTNYREFTDREENILPNQRVPSSIQMFNTEVGLHPTQKPLALMKYLISTYTNIGDTIIDPFMGSGTTLLAATQLQRYSIGIDIKKEYCDLTLERCAAQSQVELLGI